MIENVTYRWYDHQGFAGAKVGQDGAFGMASATCPHRRDAPSAICIASTRAPDRIRHLL